MSDDRIPSLIVRAGTLITQDDARRVLHDAAVHIRDGAVTAVDPWTPPPPGFSGQVLDLSGCMVLPGLINTHTHAAMTVFRGLADDLPLLEWLGGHIWPAEARLTPDIVSLGTTLAAAEMLASGTTTFCDLYIFETAVARAAQAAGMRAVLGEGVFDTPNPSYSTPGQAFERQAQLEEVCAASPLTRPWLVAHSVFATDHGTLRLMGETARETGRILTVHAAECPAETAMCLERYGRRPVAILEDLGLLGPNLLVAHGVDLTPEEIALLARTGAAVSHNPRSNMKLASGLAPVREMLRAGVRLSLGTDGAASNNALNLFAEMGAAALAAKAATGDPTALPAPQALDMATRQAAEVIGWPELGAIAPGMRADLTALDATLPCFQPPHAPVSHLVYAATGREVRLTMVEGRVLYQDGRFSSIDYPALLGEMACLMRWARAR